MFRVFLLTMLVACQSPEDSGDQRADQATTVQVIRTTCEEDDLGNIEFAIDLPKPGYLIGVLGCDTYDDNETCSPSLASGAIVDSITVFGGCSNQDISVQIMWIPVAGS